MEPPGKTPVVLDYRPATGVSRYASVWNQTVAFAARRPIRPVELMWICLGSWTAGAAAWAGLYTRWAGPRINPAFVLTSVVTASVAFGGLLRGRHWRALVWSTLWVLLAGMASGAIQTCRCPHATYLQLFGRIVAVIAGAPCSNEQPTCPWWCR